MAKKQEDTWTIHHNPPFEVVENAKVCYPNIFNSHTSYMLEFERLMMESVSGLQYQLAGLQRSAALSKQVLKL